MNMQHVRTAAGRRLRDPATKRVVPNVADPAAAGAVFKANLNDPHWYRALQRGDIVVVPAPAAASPAAAPAAAAAAPAVTAAPAAAKPAPAPGTSVEP